MSSSSPEWLFFFQRGGFVYLIALFYQTITVKNFCLCLITSTEKLNFELFMFLYISSRRKIDRGGYLVGCIISPIDLSDDYKG